MFSEHLIHLSKETSKRSQSLAKHAYRHWCFQKLLLFLMFLKKFCVYKHELAHRDELARINFTSNKILIKNRTSFICPYTARKTIFSFSRHPEKMVFTKKLRWNMIFLVLSEKMIFLFPENMILHVKREMKDDLS